MDEKNKELMKLIMADKKKYNIVIDNDSVWVEDDGIIVGEFTEYGQYLILELFQYLGLDADLC